MSDAENIDRIIKVGQPCEDKAGMTMPPPSLKEYTEDKQDDTKFKVESGPLKCVLLWPFNLLRLIYVTIGIFYFGKPNFDRWHDSDGDFDYVELPPIWKLFFTPLVVFSITFGFGMRAGHSLVIFVASKFFGRRCIKQD